MNTPTSYQKSILNEQIRVIKKMRDERKADLRHFLKMETFSVEIEKQIQILQDSIKFFDGFITGCGYALDIIDESLTINSEVIA
jgi:hypothetical protein